MAVQLNKFLTFTLEEESYGIPVLKVKEIIGMMEITYIPRMPKFIKGIINLRGKIIPIMDLRLKFGIECKEYNDRTCIIVVEIEAQNGSKLTGLVVDGVSEVLDITDENMELPPGYSENAEERYITGIGKIKEKVILLLDPENMLTMNEKEVLLKS